MSKTEKGYEALPTADIDHVLDGKEHKTDKRCDIFSKSNMAITMSYLTVGLVMSFIQTPLNVYMVKVLNAEPSLQNTIGILQTLPWSLKLVFGFLSDSVPIYGMQRKPYLAIGTVLYSFAFIAYAISGVDSVTFLALCIFIGTLGLIMVDVMADTMCVQRSRFEKEDQRGQMQASFYSVRFAGGVIGAICGASVCNKDTWGVGLTFQQVACIIGIVPFVLIVPWLYRCVSFPLCFPCWFSSHILIFRFYCFCSLKERFKISAKVMAILTRRNSEIGTPGKQKQLSAGAATERTPLQAALTNSPQVKRSTNPNAPASPQARGGYMSSPKRGFMIDQELGDVSVEEEDPGLPDTHPVFIQLNDIWETVQLKSVWRPMLFVYTYNLLQIPNVAWQSYLQLTLHFPPWILGLTVILGSFMTLAGVSAYKHYFFKTSWRSIYVGTMFLTTFFSLLQIVLIFQWNTTYLHMSNYFFSLGDDVISAYINGIQFLPVCIMYMRLCPDGAEGASYSMLTTFGNIALVCARNLGNLMAGIWDVSNGALREGDVSGLWKLSLLTSMLALLPILWLHLLPNNAEEQEELAKSKDRSRPAGIIFLVVLFGSLSWTSVSAILRVTGNL